MKKRLFVMAGLLVFASMVATQVVRADEPMLVNIPFAFVAGNATLPAGEYRREVAREFRCGFDSLLRHKRGGRGAFECYPSKGNTNPIEANLQTL